MAGPSLAFEAVPPLIHAGESFSDLEDHRSWAPKTLDNHQQRHRHLQPRRQVPAQRLLRTTPCASGMPPAVKPVRTLRGPYRALSLRWPSAPTASPCSAAPGTTPCASGMPPRGKPLRTLRRPYQLGLCGGLQPRRQVPAQRLLGQHPAPLGCRHAASLCAPCEGLTNSVNAVAFSPDGKSLLSGSRDNTLRLWDAATRQAFAPVGGRYG